jgi:predicted metalloprotease with PDZ domain
MSFAMNMYMRGPRTMFALDLELRRATNGERGVLDLLHHLDAEYARKDRGFGEDELDDILATVAGQPAVDFYRRYIDGPETADPARLLELIGYRYQDGEVEALEEPSAAQARARRDYFSISGEP